MRARRNVESDSVSSTQLSTAPTPSMSLAREDALVESIQLPTEFAA